jgi:HlyD family secretion protein
MKKWLIYTAIGAALVSAVVGYAVYANYAAKAKADEQKKQSETQSPQKFVTALGRIEPQGEVIKLTAPSGVSGAIVTS